MPSAVRPHLGGERGTSDGATGLLHPDFDEVALDPHVDIVVASRHRMEAHVLDFPVKTRNIKVIELNLGEEFLHIINDHSL